MIEIPSNERDRVSFAIDLINECQVSLPARTAYCRLMNAIAETGRYDGTKSLLNVLYKHLDRTAAHLFSPVELRFNVEFTNVYPKDQYEQAKVVGNVLTRWWQRQNTDTNFGRGVFESLKYGCCVTKQWVELDENEDATYHDKLVMPWQFGVYDESETEINNQSVLVETIEVTLPQVWRRIYKLPNAKALYERIKAHSQVGLGVNEPQNFFHQILSTSQINTGVSQARPLPGGIIQLNADPNYSIMGPQIGVPTVKVHEIWIQSVYEDQPDYVTLILIEPDILLTKYRVINLLGKRLNLQPYRIIRPNEVTNWFWGRSELVDLIEPQALLSQWCDDTKRLFGLQIDKIMGFIGEGGLTDELYAQFRVAGWTNLPTGADIKDVTPKFPPEALQLIKFLLEEINILSGFPPIMTGQGEQGVRAGSHATALMKTASPTLRDRALLVERQCAQMADLSLAIREAKDPHFYWTKADNPLQDPEETKFLLSQIPDDWQVVVDSHSSSPIFADENTQLVFAAHKMGVVDGEYVIDNVNLPNKDAAKQSLRERQKRQAEQQQRLFQQNPEIAEKLQEKAMLKQIGGGKR